MGRDSWASLYLGYLYRHADYLYLYQQQLGRNEERAKEEADVFKKSDLKNYKTEEDGQSDNAESKKKTNLG